MVAKENTGQVDFIKAFKMYSTLRHVGTRLPKLIYTMTNFSSTRMGVFVSAGQQTHYSQRARQKQCLC